MKFGTKLIHNGFNIDKETGAVSTPIYQTSTYHQFDIDNFGKYDYSRSGNPTREVLENTIAHLEGGECGYAFSSGIAAICSVISIFSKGDHILIGKDVYGGTYRAVTTIFNRFGIEFTFINGENLQDIKKKIKPNTKAIYLETPSNPLLKITDIKEACKIGEENNLIVIVDNTFMSPYFQKPLELGAHIVVHSATKFIGGHSDVVAGLVVTKNKELGKRVYGVQNGFGAILGPQDSWLILRGLKTLKIRMDLCSSNAKALANWLNNREDIEMVYYPDLDGHVGREVHLSQSSSGGAVLSFKTSSEEKALKFLRNIKNTSVGVSLGGVETIISYPAKMSHAAIPREEREKLGIGNNLIRVSLGIEDIDDIKESFNKALSL